MASEADAKPRQHAWGWRAIRLGTILAKQDWGNVLISVGFAIALGWAHNSAAVIQRDVFVYDAQIANALSTTDTIPAGVAAAVPLVMMIITTVVVELMLFNRHQSITTALTATLHFILSSMMAYISVLALNEVTKPLAGRLRPDFLKRCMPSNPDMATFEVYTQANCTSSDEYEIKEGRVSFPSGHSACMGIAAFTIVYCIWSFYFRTPRPVQRLTHSTSFIKRIFGELLSIVLFIWVLWQFVWTWGVGVSRWRDNRHNISDILGGFFLGTTVELMWAFRAIGNFEYARIQQEAAVDQAAVVQGEPLAGNGTGSSTVKPRKDGGMPV